MSATYIIKKMKEQWAELLVTHDAIEAGMIKDLLESGGIHVAIRSAKTTPYPLNIGTMGEIIVLVSEMDFDAAKALIESSGKSGIE